MKTIKKFFKWLCTPRLECKAILQSGHQCWKDFGHTDYHQTEYGGNGTMGSSQNYVWEDPSCGIHPVGFYLKK